MSSLSKILKFLSDKNIAESLDAEQLKQIAEDVIKGYQIDEHSRADWLAANQEAMRIIKNEDTKEERNGLFEGQANLVFPLLAPAIIQLAARLITHIVRNDKTVEFKILGEDTPVTQQGMQQSPDGQQQMAQQPVPGKFVKQEKAKKVSGLMNYELLVESKTWLKDTHKAMSVLAGWGVAFKQVYYDYVTNRYCSELITPEDVIVNQHISSLEQAPRITIKHRLTKNQIIEQIRAGYFSDEDLDSLELDPDDYERNDSEEIQPVYLFLGQTCYIDLDGDGYAEPYKVYVNKATKTVFSIIPAFEFKDIEWTEKGEVKRISRRLDIVDFHCIDDPEGGFYSLGLNHLLLHPNKALTAIERQLTDAGTLSNAAAVSGFITQQFKTKERSIRIKLGEFNVLECNPTVDPSKQIIPMPFREPSQVLLNMFQLLIEISKNSGFLNDILTGDVEMQNVPATTSLAFTEQATRAFKPIITKLYISLKEEFKILFHLHGKYLTESKTVYSGQDIFEVTASDFDDEVLDIVPVADPTYSSDAFKYSRQRALLEGIQFFGPVTNMQEAAIRYYTDLGFSSPETLIQQPPQQPDPKLMEVQLKAQIEQEKLKLEQMKLQLQAQKQQFDSYKAQAQVEVKTGLAQVKAHESGAKIKKLNADAMLAYGTLETQQDQVDVNREKVEVERQKVEVLKSKPAPGVNNGS